MNSQEFYCSDDFVLDIFNHKSIKKQYVYSKEEAEERFGPMLIDIPNFINGLMKWSNCSIPIFYAIVAKSSPFQSVKLSGQRYAILIDCEAMYNLMHICLKLQTNESMALLLKQKPLISSDNYSEKFFIDITRSWMSDSNVSELLATVHSYSICRAALAFILAHEFAHISHGHIDYIDSTDFKNAVLSDQERNITRRALEMDADSSATSFVALNAELIVKRAAQNCDLECKNLDEEKISIWLHQIAGIVFAFIYTDTVDLGAPSEKHPITYARHLTAKGVMSIIGSRNGLDLNGIFLEIQKALVAMYHKLSGPKSDPGYPLISNQTKFENGNEPQYEYGDYGEWHGQAHLSPLHQRWIKIRPILQTFQKGGVLAPAMSSPA